MDCAQKALPASVRCENCVMKQMAYCHLGSASRWQELDALLKRQKGRCAYTGVKILPGINASIDHIHPRSLYPERARDVKNMRFVDRRVNQAKNNMTLPQFVRMCKSVLLHAGYEIERPE